MDLLLLRSLIGSELKLAPGRGLIARVASTAQEGGRGRLSIAGVLLDAKLPPNVRAGDDIRLVVDEVTADKVVLKLAPDGAAVPLAVPAAGVPLPGGGSVRVTERRGDGGASETGAGVSSVAVRYEAAHLGPVDLRLVLDASSLRITVALTPGQPVARGAAAAHALRDAIAARLGRPVSINVTERHEPLDLYA
jgi:hypothetical protein